MFIGLNKLPKRSNNVCESINLISNNNYDVNISENEVRNVSTSSSKLGNFFKLNRSVVLNHCSGYRFIL